MRFFTLFHFNAIIQQQKQYTHQSKDIMNKALLLLNFVIIFTTQINSMIPEISESEPQITKKILLFVPLCGENLKESSRIMNNCTQVCLSWNRFFNDQNHTLTWIKHLGKKYNLSDMDVTEQLRTKGSFNRYTLQQASSGDWTNTGHSVVIKKLKLLSKGGLDLNFTYGKNKSTALMPLLAYDTTGYPQTAACFITLGADVNIRQESNGRNALMIALSTFHRSLIPELINHPHLQLNARDNKGNTPLLCALERYNSWSVPELFKTIQQLLEKGADPELGNDDGLTPLIAAEKTQIREAIELIKDAIVKKHST